MDDYATHPYRYKSVLKNVSIKGSRQDGMSFIKCKRSDKMSLENYCKYCYLIVILISSLVLIWMYGNGYDEMKDIFIYIEFLSVFLLVDVLASMVYYVRSMDIYNEWKQYVSNAYKDYPTVECGLLSYDLSHFIGIEPMDDVFHWMEVLLVISFAILHIKVLVMICSIVPVVWNLIELAGTRRSVHQMICALDLDSFSLTDQTLVFDRRDRNKYTTYMRTFLAHHTFNKLLRTSFFIFVMSTF